MDVDVKVVNQRLKVASNISSGFAVRTQQFVRFIFDMNSDWDDLTVFAQFVQGSNAYNQYLDEDNAAYLPSEIGAGTCYLILCGSGQDVRATTNCLEMTVNENRFIEDAHSTDISRSLYEQLVDMVKASISLPLEASSAADMTDHSRIYVYTGSESGYINGHWYMWDGTEWIDGGAHYAGVIDTSLSSTSANAVENRVVKQALDGKQDDFSYLIIPENNGKVLKVVDGQLSVGEGGGGGAVLIPKTITSNGVYSASADNVDGYDEVTVNVPDKAALALLGGLIDDVDCGSVPNIISYAAYMNHGISKITGSNVATIGSYAFYGCDLLSEATFPQARIVHTSAFMSCSSLRSMSFPICETIKSFAFRDCINLREASLPYVDTIEASAFYSCQRLSQVSLPACANISSYVFYGCSSLTTIDLPNLSGALGSYAFQRCVSLSSVSMPKCSAISYAAFAYCSSLESVELPNVLSIYTLAFQDCVNLQSISLPSCIYVGGAGTDNTSPFRGCSKLLSIDLPECKTLGANAFESTFISSISIPNVSTLGNWAFRFCSSLTEIDLPNVTNLGSNPFGSCISLSQVSIPKASAITQNAFNRCFALEYIYAPVASTIISTNNSEGNFGYCSSLSWASFPNVDRIPSGCFKECIKLESLYLYGSRVASLLNVNAFINTPISNSALLGRFGSIYVPSSLYSSYRTATNWSVYSSRFVSVDVPPEFNFPEL